MPFAVEINAFGYGFPSSLGVSPTFRASIPVPNLPGAASFWKVPKEDDHSIYREMSYVTLRHVVLCLDETAGFRACAGDSVPHCKITKAEALAARSIEVRNKTCDGGPQTR